MWKWNWQTEGMTALCLYEKYCSICWHTKSYSRGRLWWKPQRVYIYRNRNTEETGCYSAANPKRWLFGEINELLLRIIWQVYACWSFSFCSPRLVGAISSELVQFICVCVFFFSCMIRGFWESPWKLNIFKKKTSFWKFTFSRKFLVTHVAGWESHKHRCTCVHDSLDRFKMLAFNNNTSF